MEFRRQRYFVAVAEHLSFRRAALAVGTSQPSLSQQIRSLEGELGVALFERTKRRVRLTNAGTEYLAGVRPVLAEFLACAQRAREADAGTRGSLRIGTNGMVMIDLVPRVVRAFRAAFPEVRVALTILRNPDLVGALREGTIDLAFANGVEPDDELAAELLWQLPQRVVLPDDHPRAGNATVALRDLSGETLITHPRRAGANSEILALCRAQRFVPKAIVEVSEIADLETLVGLVACGLGITILPSPFEAIKPPAVVFKPIAAIEHRLRISVCWRKDQPNLLAQNVVRIARGI